MKSKYFPKWFNKMTPMIQTQAVLMIVSILMLIAFVVTSSIQNYISNEAIVRADSSYSLTKQSIELAQKNFNIENGALVWLTKQPEIFYNPDYSEKVQILFNFKNFGKTPAINLRYWYNYGLSPQIDTMQFSIDPIVLPPNEEINNGGSLAMEVDKRYCEIIQSELVSTGYIVKLKKFKSLFFYGMVIYQNFSGMIDTMKFMSKYTNETLKFNSFGTFNSTGKYEQTQTNK